MQEKALRESAILTKEYISEFVKTGYPLVCVQGLGFVGLAMATVIANTFDSYGNPLYNVIGIDLPENILRINEINRGNLPFKCEDKSFALELRDATRKKRNMFAGWTKDAYNVADIVVIDIPLNIGKLSHKDYSKYKLYDGPFKEAIHTVGKRIKTECLVIVETTVPPGFCSNIVKPIIKEEFLKRCVKSSPIIAHSYERVMPGKDYLNSIRKYFRTFAGIDERSTKLTRKFLTSIIDTDNYPLKEEETTEASELAKILENSYRAVNIAMIYEWTLLAEKMGVNLFSVLDGIKKRHTHSNIMKPGFGVGGYCLTKDSLLALWSADNLYRSNYGLPFSKMALETNDKMPLHTLDLIKRETNLDGKKVAILGISYRENIGDTRFSPAELFFKELNKCGPDCIVHDPYLKYWSEVPEAEIFFTLDQLKDVDIVVLAVRHKYYLELGCKEWLNISKVNALFVDANNILDDEKIRFLLSNRRDVIGVGKGHIRRMKEDLKWQKY